MKQRILAWFVNMLALTFILAKAFAIMPMTACAAQVSARPVQIGLEDGEYQIGAELSGGSGRAAITSPAELIVKDGFAYARIEWSSSHYDYMIVGEEKYYPVNEEGNSVFEIPVPVLDTAVTVIADTTAMSTPHEIEYQLTFYSEEITSGHQLFGTPAQKAIAAGFLAAAVCVLILFVFRKKRNLTK